MRKLNDTLKNIWNSAAGKQERDYLRALHNEKNLISLAHELNRFAIPNGFAIKLSSLWVDWQPQSWKWIKSRSAFDKPSVEIADLVTIIWDDELEKSGRAMILAAKMATTPSHFPPFGHSTQKEITFLESPYKFMLSNSLSGTPSPLPGFTRPDCTFDFSHSGGLDFWRWMLIKKKSTAKWKSSWLKFTLKKKFKDTHNKSFGKSLVQFMLSPADEGRFFFDCHSCEWCRLINLLLGHTKNIAYHPKAKGPARIDEFLARNSSLNNPRLPYNWAFQSLDLITCISGRSRSGPDYDQETAAADGDGNNTGGYFENFGDIPHPQCSFLLFTKASPQEGKIKNTAIK
jgi:hypothetical protein